MITVRPYQVSDARAVGIVIADTFGGFNLATFPPEQQAALLGPFYHARSLDPAHQQRIADVLQADIVVVAEAEGEVVGVLRGRHDKLQSLFVSGAWHRQGIGRRLVEAFEAECLRLGPTVIRLQATLYAVPFYLSVGYKKSTGVRLMRVFAGQGFPYQPMRKVLP
ncbi:MAG: GNAT family N-acetyltransferase [Anaerolineae bacterium]|nr:GNAT family N-acetyltransferase [Anaerolineae bacterium]